MNSEIKNSPHVSPEPLINSGSHLTRSADKLELSLYCTFLLLNATETANLNGLTKLNRLRIKGAKRQPTVVF